MIMDGLAEVKFKNFSFAFFFVARDECLLNDDLTS